MTGENMVGTSIEYVKSNLKLLFTKKVAEGEGEEGEEFVEEAEYKGVGDDVAEISPKHKYAEDKQYDGKYYERYVFRGILFSPEKVAKPPVLNLILAVDVLVDFADCFFVAGSVGNKGNVPLLLFAVRR